jgi:antitoxin ParD1/3/4
LAIFAKEAAMATMNVSLPDPLKRFVDDEVRDGGFASTSDYMRDLIRQRQRAKAEETLRQLVAEAFASGPAEPVTPAVFADLKAGLRARGR